MKITCKDRCRQCGELLLDVRIDHVPCMIKDVEETFRWLGRDAAREMNRRVLAFLAVPDDDAPPDRD